MALAAQGFNGKFHQVHGTQGMVKTRMQSTRVNQVCHPQLFNIAQPLKVRMFYQIKYQFGWNGNKPVYRVVYNLLFIQCNKYDTKMLNYG